MKHNFKDLIIDPSEQETIDSVIRAEKEICEGKILTGDLDELVKQVSVNFN